MKGLKIALVTSLLAGSLSSQALVLSAGGTLMVMAQTAVLGVATGLILLPFTLTKMYVKKVDVEAVKGDAQNFLAGDEATDALSNFMSELRSANAELQNVSDEEIAMVIVSAQ